MKLTPVEFNCLGRCLEGFFFGLYSAIFAMYLQYHASKNDTERTKNILFYAVCTLYILSFPIIICDIALSLNIPAERFNRDVAAVSEAIIFGCCDFISQSILIYRCWIVWGREIRVVIIPSILAFAFLGTWLASTGPIYVSSGQIITTLTWGITITVTSLAISMTVNALVMGLIVFKIFKVFLEVKPISAEQNLGAAGGRKLRSIIFILIESGMALFSIQLARLVVTILPTNAAYNAFGLILSIHEMLTGITPTIILVRVSMGLSFHDEDSLVAASVSLRFAPDHLNPVPETESISIGDQESRDDDISV